MPIDHTSLPVRSVATSKPFYATLLQPLTYAVALDFGHSVGFATAGGRADFWLQGPIEGLELQEGNLNTSHIAFVGKSKRDVEAFHEAGL